MELVAKRPVAALLCGRRAENQTGLPQPAVQPGATPGSSFQSRLNAILNRAAGEPAVEILGDARIVPDERSNSLIVFANKQDIQMITNIVSKVDVLLAQVLIEGIVLSVSLGDDQQVGVSWVQNPKRFDREQLLDRIWGMDYLGDANVVEVHVSALRTKLGDQDRRLIRTVRGVGYLLSG